MDKEQITQLVIDELVGDITPEDAAILRKILQESPAAAAHRDNVIKLLTQGDMTGVLDEEISAECALTILANRRHKKRKRLLLSLGAAVVMLLLIIAGSVYKYQRRVTDSTYSMYLQASLYKYPVLIFEDGSAIRLDTIAAGSIPNLSTNRQHKTISITGPIRSFTRGTFFTARGETYGLVLPEGTTIDADGNTSITLSWDPTAPAREIAVSGQIFISVAKDSHRPFVVNLPQEGKVEVLGTSFNVNTDDQGRMQVALKDGAVRVKNGISAITLKPDTAANWRKGTAISTTKFDEKAVLSWRQGSYSCSNATLRELARVMERCFPFQVRVDVPSGQDTARFSAKMTRGSSILHFFRATVIYPSNDKYSCYFDKDSIFHISLNDDRTIAQP